MSSIPTFDTNSWWWSPIRPYYRFVYYDECEHRMKYFDGDIFEWMNNIYIKHKPITLFKVESSSNLNVFEEFTIDTKKYDYYDLDRERPYTQNQCYNKKFNNWKYRK